MQETNTLLNSGILIFLSMSEGSLFPGVLSPDNVVKGEGTHPTRVKENRL